MCFLEYSLQDSVRNFLLIYTIQSANWTVRRCKSHVPRLSGRPHAFLYFASLLFYVLAWNLPKYSPEGPFLWSEVKGKVMNRFFQLILMLFIFNSLGLIFGSDGEKEREKKTFFFRFLFLFVGVCSKLSMVIFVCC